MSNRIDWTLRAAVLSALAAFASHAGAAGFAIIEHSAQGMGNAFAGGGAVAEDASTVWFNPASMTRLPTQVQGSGHVILPRFDFTQQSATTAVGTPIVGQTSNDGATDAVVPNLYYVQQLDNGLTLGLAINAPFGLSTKYDADWVGRYQALTSKVHAVNANPAIAYKLNEHLSIGGGISLQYVKATLSSAVDFRSACLGAAAAAAAGGDVATAAALGAACGGAADTSLDGIAYNEADDISVGFNLGMLYQIGDSTRFSVAYRSEIKHQLEGGVDFTLPANPVIQGLFAGSFIDDSVSAKVRMPQSLSFSAYHRFGERFALMADATWTDWSSVEQLAIVYDTDTPLRSAASVEPLDWEDVWRLGLGFHYYHSPRLTLRTGVAYDESPIPDAESRTPRLPDNDRIWLSFGASYRVSDTLQIDAGYSHLFLKDTAIRRTGGQLDRLVGTYDSEADILSVQVNYVLD